MQRNSRDNLNQIFLSEAIKKQMLFWHQMDKQLMFSSPSEQQKIIRIIGKDAIRYFQQRGLDGNGYTDETIDLMTSPEMEGMDVNPEDLAQPMYPVQVGKDTLPKFTVEPGSEVGHLILEKEDLSGTYDYIPDIESMRIPDEGQMTENLRLAIDMMTGVDSKSGQPTGLNAMMQAEGYKVKAKELAEDYFERLGMKDADKYFEKVKQPQQIGGANVDQTGGAGLQFGLDGGGAIPAQGMGGMAQAAVGGQAQPGVPGPVQIQ